MSKCDNCIHVGVCHYIMFGDSDEITECRHFNEERPHGECKTCSHRDPEDKKCDCGGLERIGCQFPVSDDYYCKYYECDVRRRYEGGGEE